MKNSAFKIWSYIIVTALFLICFSFIFYICLQSENSNEMTLRIPMAAKNYDKNDPCAGIYAKAPYYNQMNEKERVADVLQYVDTIIAYNPDVAAAKKELGIDFAAKRDFYEKAAANCKNDFEFYCVMMGISADLTGKYDYLDIHMVDTFVPDWTKHYINVDHVLKKTSAERRGFVDRTSRMFKNIREFVPQYYDIYKDKSYIFTCVTPDEYVCSNENNAYTYWTLTQINGKPISDFVSSEHLFSAKLQFDENNKFYRKEICFNEVKGEPVMLTLKSLDGEIVEKEMKFDIVADMTYKHGKTMSREEKYRMIYEFSELGNKFYLPNAHFDDENNYCYLNVRKFDYSSVFRLEELEEAINKNDNIIVDLRDTADGLEKAMYENFYPFFNAKDGNLKYSYALSKAAAEEFEIGDKMGIIDPNDSGVLTEDSEKIYLSYDINANGGTQFSDKNIYYIIDENIGNFAEQYITMVKENDLGTVIGRRSFGDGLQNHEAGFTLKYSGLIFSTNIFESTNPDGSSNNVYGVAPDINVPLSKEHFYKVVDMVQKGDEPKTFEEIAEFDDILYKALEEVKKNPKNIEE